MASPNTRIPIQELKSILVISLLESFKNLAAGGVVGGTVKESLGKFKNLKKESRNILGSLGMSI